ncbi:arsenic resistance protein [Limobrevibacterium gyesilva]
MVGLLLGLSAITVPWDTLLLSVGLYIVVPVVASQIWRRSILARGGEGALTHTLKMLQPASLAALLVTLVLLFGLQGRQILAQPLIILLLAVAAAISLFGFESGAALATVVGVLVEVQVMLSVVAAVMRSRWWYERGRPMVARVGESGGRAATHPR